jgi:tetratricopeptide (TPR) repeat protein
MVPLSEAEAILDKRGDFSSVDRADLDRMLAEYWRATDISKSLSYARRAINLFRDRFPNDANYAEALRVAGFSEQDAFHFAAAESFFHQAVQVELRLNAPKANRVQSVIMLADTQSRLLMDSQAARYYREGIELSRRIKGAAHIDTLQGQMRFGAFLRRTARYRESIDLLRATEAQAVAALGDQETFHLPTIRLELANSLLSWGDTRTASPLLERALAVREKSRPNSVQHANILQTLCEQFTQEGRFELATETLDRVAAIYSHIGTKAMKTNLPLNRAENLLAEGRDDDALAMLDETERLISADRASDAQVWNDPVRSQKLRLLRARAELHRHHYAVTEMILNGLAAETVNPDSTQYFAALADERTLLLGQLYGETQRTAKALPLLRATLAWRSEHLNPEGPQVLEAITALAEVTAVSGSRSDTAAVMAQADRIAANIGKLGPQFTQPLLRAHRNLR